MKKTNIFTVIGVIIAVAAVVGGIAYGVYRFLLAKGYLCDCSECYEFDCEDCDADDCSACPMCDDVDTIDNAEDEAAE